MQFTDVIGQYEARERLLRLVAEHRVPHAMLFTGPEGSGKLALALAFAFIPRNTPQGQQQ